MIIPQDFRFLSPTIKIALIVFECVLLIMFVKKYRKKPSGMAVSLIMGFIFIILSTLFSSFDILLGWRDLKGTDSYVGMGFAFIFNAAANVAYFWLILEVFFVKETWNLVQKTVYISYAILEFLITTLAMVFRIQGKDVFLWMAAHMLLSVAIYGVLSFKAMKMKRKIDQQSYRARFVNLQRSGISLIMILVLFVADSFFSEVTLYSLLGWAFMAIGLYFFYKSYV